MSNVSLLTSPWRESFESVVSLAATRLLLCAPYVSEAGAQAVRRARNGKIGPSEVLLLTDLSPLAICAGATDPAALLSLTSVFPQCRFVHLPRLHAKVYAADGQRAIVTSGNLTNGGLVANYECGVMLEDSATVGRLESHIKGYAALGGVLDATTLTRLCELAEQGRAAYQAVARSGSRHSVALSNALSATGDTLLRARLSEGALHTVLARTIRFLLERHGPLSTADLHPLIEQIHPDLCDNSVDRVIDGKRFGKKWKHAARTAQQQLKKKGAIALLDGKWVTLDSAG